MRILVSGGRNYGKTRKVFNVLDSYVLGKIEPGDQVTVIHGGARGADSLAGQWAKMRNHKVRVFYAEWDRYGRAAGALRNIQMAREGKPDIVIAFPGGRGTAHMIRTAKRFEIPVLEVKDEPADSVEEE